MYIPPPPNLNCSDIQFRNFKVVGADPGFDGDREAKVANSSKSLKQEIGRATH
jgi:hypothetical protein